MNAAAIGSAIVTYGPWVVSAAAAAAAALPQGAPSSTWATVRQVIDLLALNFGNAANKPKP